MRLRHTPAASLFARARILETAARVVDVQPLPAEIRAIVTELRNDAGRFRAIALELRARERRAQAQPSMRRHFAA